DPVLVVDIDRVGARPALRHRIVRPDLRRRVVAADAASVPEAHPEHPLGVRPDATRTDPLARRLDNGGCAGLQVDAGDMVAGERAVPDLAGGGNRDAVGAAAARRRPGVDLAGCRVDPAVDAALAGEPDNAALVDDRGVEIGAREPARPGKDLDRPPPPTDP